MSVWKKASKSHQKTHRERHQPESRQHLGLLEKKKDYVRRARDYNEKKATLKVLTKRTLNKNPDEFYHHMINSKIDNGRHFEKDQEDEDTPVQIRLMQSQDLKYINTRRTQEVKKIERLQAQLHLSSIDHEVTNNHIRFEKNKSEEDVNLKILSSKELPDVDMSKLAEGAAKKKHIYTELFKRINREKELTVIQNKIEIKRQIASRTNVLPPKKIKKGNKDRAPVYLWKYERKK